MRSPDISVNLAFAKIVIKPQKNTASLTLDLANFYNFSPKIKKLQSLVIFSMRKQYHHYIALTMQNKTLTKKQSFQLDY